MAEQAAPSGEKARSARERAEQLVREFLSPPDPLKPGKKLIQIQLVDIGTGKQLKPLPSRWQQIKDGGGWFGKLVADPANNINASMEDYILYEQDIFINHPVVSMVLCVLWHSATALAQQ